MRTHIVWVRMYCTVSNTCTARPYTNRHQSSSVYCAIDRCEPSLYNRDSNQRGWINLTITESEITINTADSKRQTHKLRQKRNNNHDQHNRHHKLDTPHAHIQIHPNTKHLLNYTKPLIHQQDHHVTQQRGEKSGEIKTKQQGPLLHYSFWPASCSLVVPVRLWRPSIYWVRPTHTRDKHTSKDNLTSHVRWGGKRLPGSQASGGEGPSLVQPPTKEVTGRWVTLRGRPNLLLDSIRVTTNIGTSCSQ